MPRYRLLAIDIDGTLVNSRDELTLATQRAVRLASHAGVRVLLATGRRYSRVLPLVDSLGLADPVITASGALIKRPSDHETIYCASFERQLLCDVLTIVEQAGFDALMYGDTYHAGFDFFCPRLEVDQPELAEYLELNPGCHSLWPTLMSDPPEGLFAGFAMGTRAQMWALHEELQRQLPNQLYTHVIRSPRYRGYMCEIAPQGVTKWAGVLQLAAGLGIDPAEICAVGDDVNDLPMVTGAGLGIAMGNAVDELKAAADRIAPTHDDDGLVQVVDWVLG
jgi:Cof subfamily protein (haloacid dehalogenase superfamily)